MTRPALAALATALALPFGLVALPAQAEPWRCVMTVECMVGEDCADTAMQLDVIAADHAGDLFLSSVIGPRPVTRLTPAGALPASYASAGRHGLAELLTIETDRTAIMTVHQFDETPAAITLFGTCEAL